VEEEHFEENDSSVVEFETHPRRVLQKKKKGFTVGGLIRNTVLGAVVATGLYGAYRAPDIINWGQQQITTIGNSDNGGRYDLPAPSGRSLETPNLNQGPITPDQLPHIKPITFPMVRANPGYSTTVGLDAYPEGGDKNTAMPVEPVAEISGYLVGKEKQADGSFVFYMEVPYLNGSDILNTSKVSTTPVFKETDGRELWNPDVKIKEDIAGGFIITLKLFPNETNGYPFLTGVGFGETVFEDIDGGGAAGPDALYAWARVGDPMRALVDLAGVDFTTGNWPKALQQYVSSGYAGNVTEAQAQMQTVLDQNTNTLNQIKADSGKPISLADQLNGRYTITPNDVAFLPSTPATP
jgi:hypothetical protein